MGAEKQLVVASNIVVDNTDEKLLRCVNRLQELRQQLNEGLVTDDEVAREAIDFIYVEMIPLVTTLGVSEDEENK